MKAQLFRQLFRLLEPAASAAGYELVDIEFSPASARALLRIFIDRLDGQPVTIEDCAQASRLVGATLDEADPVGRAYDLEVSSPGFERPLRTSAHFERFLGSEARIELAGPIEGRKRFRGRLVALANGELLIDVDGREWRLPLATIHKARLVA